MTRLNYLATPGLEGIKIFSCSSLLSMKFILLMNVKMHKINGILIFEPRRDKTNALHLVELLMSQKTLPWPLFVNQGFYIPKCL